MLTFDADVHRYYWNGLPVPNVTTVLEPIEELWRVSPEILQRKADLGRRIHLACQLDDDDDLDESSVQDDEAPYLEAWRRFRTDKRVMIESAEEMLYHPIYRYAGTLDRVLRFDGFRWLADIKISVEVYASAAVQTAAYLQAKRDQGIQKRAAIQLRDDGRYRLREFTDPADWPCFLSLLTIHNWKQKHDRS